MTHNESRDDFGDFYRECDLLRSNDPSIRQVDVKEFPLWPYHFGGYLGQSLLHNTSVVSIGLTVKGAMMDNEINHDFDDRERSAATTTPPILQYLRHNASLRLATVWEGSGPEDAVPDRPSGHIVAAMAKSPSMEHLRWIGRVPVAAMAHLLCTTRSMRQLTLSMDFFKTEVPPEQDRQCLEEALKANETLESIRLRYYCQEIGGDNVYLHDMIPGLVGHSKLECVAIEQVGDPIDIPKFLMDSLTCLVQSDQSNARHIILTNFLIVEKSWTTLLRALHSSRAVERLSLENCRVDQNSTESFIHTLQSSLISDKSAGGLVRPCRRRRPLQLTLSQIRDDESANNMFKGTYLSKVLDGLWSNSSAQDARTCSEPTETSNQARLELSALEVSFGEGKTVRNIAKCLPDAIHLRDLTITDNSDTQRGCKFLVTALRKNGSIQRVATKAQSNYSPIEGGRECLFTEEEWGLVDVYCKRNSETPKLLASMRSLNVDNDAGGNGSRKRIRLMPTLMAVVQPAGKTAPNAVLIGLLATTADDDAVMGPELNSDDGPSPSKRQRV